jgi:Family of unknown function (DUF5681)
MTTDNSEGDRKVGYKSPPRHSQFKQGHSGNSPGKLKGVRNLASDVKRTLRIPVKFDDEQGRASRISTQEYALLRLRSKALKGDARSLDRFLGLAQIYNDSAPPPPIDFDRREDALVMASIVQRIRMAAEAPSDTNGPKDDSEKPK